MKKNRNPKSGFPTLRVFLAFTLCFLGALCAFLSWAAPLPSELAKTGKQPALSSSATKHSFVQRIFAAIWRPAASDSIRPIRRGAMRKSASSFNGGQFASGGAQTLTPIVGDAVTPVLSLPVRDLPAESPFTISVGPGPEVPLRNRTGQLPRDPRENDPVVQTTTAPTVGMPPGQRLI
jgi:hypothetical protein